MYKEPTISEYLSDIFNGILTGGFILLVAFLIAGFVYTVGDNRIPAENTSASRSWGHFSLVIFILIDGLLLYNEIGPTMYQLNNLEIIFTVAVQILIIALFFKSVIKEVRK